MGPNLLHDGQDLELAVLHRAGGRHGYGGRVLCECFSHHLNIHDERRGRQDKGLGHGLIEAGMETQAGPGRVGCLVGESEASQEQICPVGQVSQAEAGLMFGQLGGNSGSPYRHGSPEYFMEILFSWEPAL